MLNLSLARKSALDFELSIFVATRLLLTALSIWVLKM